ncbi:MAG: ATP-binding protein [Bryobacterales bacterium]|nr:ATP-binding protein [Bryobacterales bacterium]
MATTTQPPRLAKSGQVAQQITRPSISDIKSSGSGLPNRYVLHAVEGWGKTSFGAQTPRPIFIQTRQETGLETLIDNGQLPETPHFPEVTSWLDLLGAIDTLIEEPHDYRTLVLDTLNGAERLCHEHVAERDFDGIWTDKGFEGYKRGYEVSLADWRGLLAKLDQLRSARRMSIMCLAHTKIETFKNPLGPDYDRFQSALYKSTAAITNQWADVILFGNFDVSISAVQENKKTGAQKGKGKGGKIRVLYCEQDASMVAKNRLGLPSEIEMGSSPAEAWANFMAAVKQGKGENANG